YCGHGTERLSGDEIRADWHRRPFRVGCSSDSPSRQRERTGSGHQSRGPRTTCFRVAHARSATSCRTTAQGTSLTVVRHRAFLGCVDTPFDATALRGRPNTWAGPRSCKTRVMADNKLVRSTVLGVHSV